MAEKVGERCIGPLMQDPQLIDVSVDLYLRAAAEVPFDVEHVIDLDDEDEAVTRVMFSEPPTRLWPDS